MDQQRSQVRIAALADTQQLDAAAGARLPRDQTKESRKLPPGAEAAGIADRRDDRRRSQLANTRDRGEPLTLRLPALPDSDLTLELSDPRQSACAARRAASASSRRTSSGTGQRVSSASSGPGLRQQCSPSLRHRHSELVQQACGPGAPASSGSSRTAAASGAATAPPAAPRS